MQDHTLWFPYAQMRTAEEPIEIVSAQGCLLHTADGRTLVDAISSWWCVIHGYNHPEINKAATEQLGNFAHVMLGGLSHHPAQALARKLAAIAPQGLSHVFFADSGSVGMEVALKMCVQWHRNQGRTGRTRFLSLLGAYHGDTTGVMSIGDPEEGMHHLFQGYLPKQVFVEPPIGWDGSPGLPPQGSAMQQRLSRSIQDLEQAFARHARELAGMVVEPLMQGAGGFRFYHPEYLRVARRLCDQYDLPLVFDEVATGFGRTGRLFAAEHAGVSPDIMVLAKGLTAGYLGMSATLANDRIYNAFLGDGYAQAFLHGPTFMGHATAAAVALKGIEIFERDDYLSRITSIETQLHKEWLPIQGKGIADVRVLGAVGCIEVEDASVHQGLQDFAANRGVWLRPFDRTVYTAPPYIITPDQLSRICQVVREWFTGR